MCEPELSGDNVWHVMDVLEGSPAESAGLVPYGDWIVGWSGGVLSAENDFYDLVEAVSYPLVNILPKLISRQHIDKSLRLYVYSYDFDTLREAVVIPNHHWGGEGLLGCVFGYTVPVCIQLFFTEICVGMDFYIAYLPNLPTASPVRYLQNSARQTSTKSKIYLSLQTLITMILIHLRVPENTPMRGHYTNAGHRQIP